MTDTSQQIPVPQSYTAAFTNEDREAVARIIGWLNTSRRPRTWLARAARMSVATNNQVLKGKYPASPTGFIRKMTAVIDNETQREAAGTGAIPYVPSTLYGIMEVACDRARRNASFAIVTGYVGVGKTAAIKHYQKSHPHTLLLEANPDMSPGVMLRDLLMMLSAAAPRSMDEKFAGVVDALKNTSIVLVVDEAETMQARCLHYLRRIRDKAGIGIVLSGTDRLMALVRPVHGTFDQIRSRVCFWPPNIKGIERKDADAIARAALTASGVKKEELTTEVLDTLWQYCEGSARMLTENMIPAIRDYAVGRHMLSAQVIQSIAEQALFLAPRKLHKESV